jgi:glycosyltransferase involved in cell wall biosynthesis
VGIDDSKAQVLKEVNPVKVVIVMPLAEQRGGSEMTFWDLMYQGRNAGMKWLVIFLEDGLMVEQVRGLGIDARVVRSGRLRHLHLLIATMIRIAFIVRRERADMVVSWMWLAQLSGGFGAILAGVPSIWYQQELPDSKDWLKRMITILPARGVVANTKAVKEAQEQLWPKRQTYLVYPGVALERFDPSIVPSPVEVRRKLGLPSTIPLIGIVGRLQRWKGIHVLVEAMPNVLQRYPDAHCVVVGGKHDLEPDYGGYLKERISVLELGDRVILAGLQRNVPDWMQAFDVFVHASNNEPFGIVVIEAMALGKPVIAGDTGGPTEIITNGVNGLLTPYGDADALASAILRYLDDREFAHRVGVAARERALDFSSERYAQNFIQVIHDSMLGVS